MNGIQDVAGMETASKEHRNLHSLANGAADAPIVRPARAAEFLYRQLLVSRIQQQRVHPRRQAQRAERDVG